MKILVVEDDIVLCEVLKTVLEKNGYAVDLTSDGEEGLYLAQQYSPDAIVLDIILPNLDGLSLLKRLRDNHINTPVLLLTKKNAVKSRIEGLDLGADDYLPKPFDSEELLARLRAIIRRGNDAATNALIIGDVEINLSAKSVARAGALILLTAKEYRLLEYLALNAGKVLSRTELMDHLYGHNFESDSNLIDVYVTYLRNKIDKPYPVKLIHTVRGMGYILKIPAKS